MEKKTVEKESGTQKVERRRKERFEASSTHLPGIQLRVEPGVQLDILRQTIDNFYNWAKEFAKTDFRINHLADQQKIRKEEIIGVAKGHEGLRGLKSEKDNFILTVIPRESIIWNRDVLKESMGIAYPAVTREALAVNVSIPVGFVTEKGITISEEVMAKAIGEALIDLGISREDLAKVVRQEVNISLDEKKLTEMITQGQVELLPGAKTVEIVWSLRVDPLKKPEKK